MSTSINALINYDAELMAIDEVIDVYERKLETLRIQRCELISRKQDVDMDTILECIRENELSAIEVMALITSVAKDKARRKQVS